MNNIRQILMFILTFSFLGCANSLSTKEQTLLEDLKVKVEIKKIKYIEDKNTSFVYGRLFIQNPNKELRSFDLNCIGLRTNSLTSTTLYVDSIASVLTSNYQATNGQIAVDVYWLFDADLSNNILNDLTIFIPDHKNRKECVTYNRL